MNNKFNFKIVGSGPTGLLLSIALSKFDCNIFLTDLLTKDRLIDKDKTYAITHSTRKILSKFRLWEKLEPYLFGFDSLSISDSVTSANTNLSINLSFVNKSVKKILQLNFESAIESSKPVGPEPTILKLNLFFIRKY